MSKLILGITGPSLFSPEVQKMTEDYFKATPITINQNKEEDLLFVLKQVHGVILAGGNDICPLTYGEEITNGDNLSKFDKDRDKREIFIIDFCFKHNIPILGICRGHQLLGVLHNLYLIKDISGTPVCHNPSSMKIDMAGLPCHFVHILESHRKEFWDKEYCNSFHHQALFFNDNVISDYRDENGVEILGYAYLNHKDGKNAAQKIVEVMRGVKNPWITCQFHCEDDYEKSDASKKILDKFKEMLSAKK